MDVKNADGEEANRMIDRIDYLHGVAEGKGCPISDWLQIASYYACRPKLLPLGSLRLVSFGAEPPSLAIEDLGGDKPGNGGDRQDLRPGDRIAQNRVSQQGGDHRL